MDADSVCLASIAVGSGGRVSALDGPPDLRRRLLEMGLTVGANVKVIRRAPLGDPMELRVRGYNLSIRAHDAAGVLVSVDGGPP